MLYSQSHNNNKMRDAFLRDQDYSIDNYESNNRSLFGQIQSQNNCFRLNEDSKDLPFIQLEKHNKYTEQKTTMQSFYDQIQLQQNFIIPSQIIYESAPHNKQELSSNSQKIKSKIYVSMDTLYTKSKIEKGDRFQTKNLSKNLHTETAKHLRSLAFLHQFSKAEVQNIRQFCNSNKSIDSFKFLLKDQSINERVRSFYQSTYFVQEILKSKMEMRTKLVMIKYLKKIASLTYDKHIKAWKKDCNDF